MRGLKSMRIKISGKHALYYAKLIGEKEYCGVNKLYESFGCGRRSTAIPERFLIEEHVLELKRVGYEFGFTPYPTEEPIVVFCAEKEVKPPIFYIGEF